MKNKNKTYLLLTVVLGVWGAAGYQILSGLNTGTPKIEQQDITIAFNPKTNTEIDTFSVQTFTRDPFLGTLAKSKIKKGKPRSVKKAESFVWLPITYQGIIKKQASDQQIFVMSINGNQYLLKQGQNRDGVTLVRGNTKFIVVRYKNKQKTIDIH